MPCAPLRILCNKDNLLLGATLTPSSVKPAINTILQIAAARTGTGGVTLTGEYTGAEDATLDIQILDTTADTERASAPVMIGQGTGTLTDIALSGFAAQDVTVELKDAGIPITSAALDFEGVRLVAVTPGADGDNIRVHIDQSGLTFAATDFSLLADLQAGKGGPTTPLYGSAYDWEAAALGADGIIPAIAKRIAFGEDTSAVYLQYKKYVDNAWQYYFVPALLRDVAKGTPVKEVTGGRTVQIIDSTGPTTETYTGVATVYDLLEQVRENSALVYVDGIVANDRTPTGQAARDLLARTDAHVEPSSGSGSVYATGFASAFAAADAPTELVTATCYAVNGQDHPLAHIGAERWRVSGSVSGDLADAVTGIPYAATNFGFVIPQRLPWNFGVPRGKFSVVDINYQPRTEEEGDPPPICVVAMALGPNAVDETITLRYKRRPSAAGACDCSRLPIPHLSSACLGATSEGGQIMDYSAANQARLLALRTWAADIIRAVSVYQGYTTQAPFVSQPISYTDMRTLAREVIPAVAPSVGAGQLEENAGAADKGMFYQAKTLFEVVDDWEITLKSLNDIPDGSPDLKAAGESEWDTAVAEFEGDIDGNTGGGSPISSQTATYPAYENLSAGDAVGIFTDNDGVQKARLAVRTCSRYGFVLSSYTTGQTATVYWWGVVTGRGITPGNTAYMDGATAGAWTEGPSIPGGLTGVTTGSDITVADTGVGGQIVIGNLLALLSDRYKARMQQVLTAGGISPLGFSDASAMESGDGCWRDWGDAYWWEVVGSEDGHLAPAFNNHPYYASQLAANGKGYFSLKAWGLQINVSCVSKLKVDDEITLAINNAGQSTTYQIGDELQLPIIAGRDLYLAGGQDGNTVQVWNVRGSVAGALANYTLDTASPTAYSASGLGFQINQGGIPFVVSDRFTFSAEGGHFQWRVNGGAWDGSSPPLDIPDGSIALYEGLSATFPSGAAPSFAVDDMYSFRILQPRAASNIETPGPEAWQWVGDGQDMTADLGETETISNLAIGLHTLPEGTTITVTGAASDGSPWTPDWTETLTWREGPIYAELATERTARYLRFSFSGASGAMIGYLFAGVPVVTTLSADLTLSRSYKLLRGSGGLYQGGRYLGKAVSGEIEWTEGALPEADVAKLQAVCDWVKAHDDEPVVIVPNVTRPQEAFIGQIAADEVEWPDVFMYGPNVGRERRHSVRIPVAGVWS